MPPTSFSAALRDLRSREIRFILVGGLAAVLHGAPVHTYDLDIVYARDSGNVDRLLTFLESADAIFRVQPDRRLRPDRSHLAGGGHLNLLTRYGALDLLASIGRNLGYSDLLPECKEMDIGDGCRIQVLSLERIILVKEDLGSDKDRATLPILRHVLAEIRRKG